MFSNSWAQSSNQPQTVSGQQNKHEKASERHLGRGVWRLWWLDRRWRWTVVLMLFWRQIQRPVLGWQTQLG